MGSEAVNVVYVVLDDLTADQAVIEVQFDTRVERQGIVAHLGCESEFLPHR